MIIEKYKLIIFDLDGTLVHTTAEYRYFIIPRVLKQLGNNKRINLKVIDKFWFNGNRGETIRDGFGCDAKQFWKMFHKEVKTEERAKYTHVYDDVWITIKKLKNNGKILAVTTGAPKQIANMEVDLLPKEQFEKIISITSTRYKAKPHPESLIGCLKFCKTEAEEAVYIGNSMEDSEYATAASVDFIYLERREHEFIKKSIVTIHSLHELL